MEDWKKTRTGYTKGELKKKLFPKITITDDMRDHGGKIEFQDELRREFLKEQRIRGTKTRRRWINDLLDSNMYTVGIMQWKEWLEIRNRYSESYRDEINISDWNAYILETHATLGNFEKCIRLSHLGVLSSRFGNWIELFGWIQDYGFEPVLYELREGRLQYYYLSLKGIPAPPYVTTRIDFNRQIWLDFTKGTLKKR
jgi:hypothetical protein